MSLSRNNYSASASSDVAVTTTRESRFKMPNIPVVVKVKEEKPAKPAKGVQEVLKPPKQIVPKSEPVAVTPIPAVEPVTPVVPNTNKLTAWHLLFSDNNTRMEKVYGEIKMWVNGRERLYDALKVWENSDVGNVTELIAKEQEFERDHNDLLKRLTQLKKSYDEIKPTYDASRRLAKEYRTNITPEYELFQSDRNIAVESLKCETLLEHFATIEPFLGTFPPKSDRDPTNLLLRETGVVVSAVRLHHETMRDVASIRAKLSGFEADLKKVDRYYSAVILHHLGHLRQTKPEADDDYVHAKIDSVNAMVRHAAALSDEEARSIDKLGRPVPNYKKYFNVFSSFEDKISVIDAAVAALKRAVPDETSELSQKARQMNEKVKKILPVLGDEYVNLYIKAVDKLQLTVNETKQYTEFRSFLKKLYKSSPDRTNASLLNTEEQNLTLGKYTQHIIDSDLYTLSQFALLTNDVTLWLSNMTERCSDVSDVVQAVRAALVNKNKYPGATHTLQNDSVPCINGVATELVGSFKTFLSKLAEHATVGHRKVLPKCVEYVDWMLHGLVTVSALGYLTASFMKLETKVVTEDISAARIATLAAESAQLVKNFTDIPSPRKDALRELDIIRREEHERLEEITVINTNIGTLIGNAQTTAAQIDNQYESINTRVVEIEKANETHRISVSKIQTYIQQQHLDPKNVDTVIDVVKNAIGTEARNKDVSRNLSLIDLNSTRLYSSKTIRDFHGQQTIKTYGSLVLQLRDNVAAVSHAVANQHKLVKSEYVMNLKTLQTASESYTQHLAELEQKLSAVHDTMGLKIIDDITVQDMKDLLERAQKYHDSLIADRSRAENELERDITKFDSSDLFPSQIYKVELESLNTISADEDREAIDDIAALIGKSSLYNETQEYPNMKKELEKVVEKYEKLDDIVGRAAELKDQTDETAVQKLDARLAELKAECELFETRVRGITSGETQNRLLARVQDITRRIENRYNAVRTEYDLYATKWLESISTARMEKNDLLVKLREEIERCKQIPSEIEFKELESAYDMYIGKLASIRSHYTETLSTLRNIKNQITSSDEWKFIKDNKNGGDIEEVLSRYSDLEPTITSLTAELENRNTVLNNSDYREVVNEVGAAVSTPFSGLSEKLRNARDAETRYSQLTQKMSSALEGVHSGYLELEKEEGVDVKFRDDLLRERERVKTEAARLESEQRFKQHRSLSDDIEKLILNEQKIFKAIEKQRSKYGSQMDSKASRTSELVQLKNAFEAADVEDKLDALISFVTAHLNLKDPNVSDGESSVSPDALKSVYSRTLINESAAYERIKGEIRAKLGSLRTDVSANPSNDHFKLLSQLESKQKTEEDRFSDQKKQLDELSVRDAEEEKKVKTEIDTFLETIVDMANNTYISAVLLQLENAQTKLNEFIHTVRENSAAFQSNDTDNIQELQNAVAAGEKMLALFQTQTVTDLDRYGSALEEKKEQLVSALNMYKARGAVYSAGWDVMSRIHPGWLVLGNPGSVFSEYKNSTESAKTLFDKLTSLVRGLDAIQKTDIPQAIRIAKNRLEAAEDVTRLATQHREQSSRQKIENGVANAYDAVTGAVSELRSLFASVPADLKVNVHAVALMGPDNDWSLCDETEPQNLDETLTRLAKNMSLSVFTNTHAPHIVNDSTPDLLENAQTKLKLPEDEFVFESNIKTVQQQLYTLYNESLSFVAVCGREWKNVSVSDPEISLALRGVVEEVVKSLVVVFVGVWSLLYSGMLHTKTVSFAVQKVMGVVKGYRSTLKLASETHQTFLPTASGLHPLRALDGLKTELMHTSDEIRTKYRLLIDQRTMVPLTIQGWDDYFRNNGGVAMLRNHMAVQRVRKSSALLPTEHHRWFAAVMENANEHYKTGVDVVKPVLAESLDIIALKDAGKLDQYKKSFDRSSAEVMSAMTAVGEHNVLLREYVDAKRIVLDSLASCKSEMDKMCKTEHVCKYTYQNDTSDHEMNYEDTSDWE